MKSFYLKPAPNFNRFIWQERMPGSSQEPEDCDVGSYEELLQEVEAEQQEVKASEKMNDYEKWELLEELEPIFRQHFSDLQQLMYKTGELYGERQSGVEVDYTKYEQYLVNAYEKLCLLDEPYQKIKTIGLHDKSPFDERLLHKNYSFDKYGYWGTFVRSDEKTMSLDGIEDEYIMAKAIVIEIENLILDRGESDKFSTLLWQKKEDGNYQYFIKEYSVSDKSIERAEKGELPRGTDLNPQLQQARSKIEHINLAGDKKASWGARLLHELRTYFFKDNE